MLRELLCDSPMCTGPDGQAAPTGVYVVEIRCRADGERSEFPRLPENIDVWISVYGGYWVFRGTGELTSRIANGNLCEFTGRLESVCSDEFLCVGM